MELRTGLERRPQAWERPQQRLEVLSGCSDLATFDDRPVAVQQTHFAGLQTQIDPGHDCDSWRFRFFRLLAILPRGSSSVSVGFNYGSTFPVTPKSASLAAYRRLWANLLITSCYQTAIGRIELDRLSGPWQRCCMNTVVITVRPNGCMSALPPSSLPARVRRHLRLVSGLGEHGAQAAGERVPCAKS